VVICLERGADLHMSQLMPLPLTVFCLSKIQIGFTFLVPAHPGSPEKKAVKRVCVCVYCDLLQLYLAVCILPHTGLNERLAMPGESLSVNYLHVCHFSCQM